MMGDGAYHHGLKNPILYPFWAVSLLDLRDKMLIELLCLVSS